MTADETRDLMWMGSPIQNNAKFIVHSIKKVSSNFALLSGSLGPISSTGLRRVFVLKTSYEVCTLKIGFHQTIELCELLTFCRIFKTNI